jgi:hypothetical protein
MFFRTRAPKARASTNCATPAAWPSYRDRELAYLSAVPSNVGHNAMDDRFERRWCPDSKTQMTSVRVRCGIYGRFKHLMEGVIGYRKSADKRMLQGEDQVEHKRHQCGREANQCAVEDRVR